MKSVIISIRPKWCELIAAREKTIEVRKDRPNINEPFKCYIYETRGRKHTRSFMHTVYGEHGEYIDFTTTKYEYFDGSGKIIGEFLCDKVFIVDCDSVEPFDRESNIYIGNECSLTREEFISYAGFKCACGWHISDLLIYDKPKELSEFGMTRAPQNWCYTKEEEK